MSFVLDQPGNALGSAEHDQDDEDAVEVDQTSEMPVDEKGALNYCVRR